MNVTQNLAQHPNPRFDVEALLAKHGLYTVLRSIVAATIQRRYHPPPVDHLPNHLRRDIGLETRHERPIPQARLW